jgi:hypothetical protein
MALVEQAVFTSAETDRSAGYQVVASSPGVSEADARQLAVWGPSHDSLLELGPDAVSINFHALPSGAYCVSRTTSAGWEYSGRGGLRVYTQCLIVSTEVLARFANNPFALTRAAVASGAMQVLERVPRRLEPLSLVGGAAPVDQTLLARLAVNPGPQRMAALVQAALDATRLAVAGTPSAGDLIAGLLSCLPPPCRPAFSFCTGLKFSSRRPFRLVALSGDSAEKRWVAHQNNITVLDLSEGMPLATGPIDGWARLITRVLASGRIAFLAAQLSKRRFDLTPADLPALGLQLLEDLDASAFRTEEAPARARVEKENSADGPSYDSAARPVAPGRAHAAHCQFARSMDAAAAAKLAAVAPSQALEAASPEILEKLEHLDDVVYEALSGQQTALEELQTLWPAVLAELGDDLVAESREQYLRYALAISEQCVAADGVRDPARAVQALDVLCLLFNEP